MGAHWPAVPAQRIDGSELYRLHVEGDRPAAEAVAGDLAGAGWTVVGLGPHPDRPGVHTIILEPQWWRGQVPQAP